MSILLLAGGNFWVVVSLGGEAATLFYLLKCSEHIMRISADADMLFSFASCLIFSYSLCGITRFTLTSFKAKAPFLMQL